MIKAIIFDFGGVLGSDADEWNTNFKEILNKTGLSGEQIEAIFDKHWPKLKIGKADLLVFWQDVYKQSKNIVQQGSLERIYRENIQVNNEVIKLAENLKERGLRVVILANESKQGMKNKIERYNLNKVFEKVYCSSDLGVAKPDNEVFKIVLSDMKLQSNEVVFIDDRQANVDAAKSLGINAILFVDFEHLQEDLKLI